MDKEWMKENKPKSKERADIPSQSEKVLKGKTSDLKKAASGDIQNLVHELQVHQIELEMQNEELRRISQDLEDARNRFSDLYDFAPIGYFTFDKNGLILEANLTGAKKLGRERAHLIKTPFTLYIAPDFKDVFSLHMREVFDTETQKTCELRLVDKNGKQFDVLLESMPVRDIVGNLLTRTAMSDLNERKAMEDTFRKNFTEGALNSLQDLFYVFDLNGRFLRWNKSFSAITGYSDEEIYTKKPTDFFFEEDVQSISNAIEMVVKNGTATVAAEIVTKNGGHIDYEFTGTLLKDCFGKPLGICGIGRNISERKKMELEYKTILQSSMDGFYITDLQGRILDVNDSYCSMIGYSREELLNMSLKNIEAIETEEMIAERIHRILKVGRDRFETHHKCKDGRIVEIEASVNYNEAGGGKFFTFMRDITEHNQVQKEYKESETRLSEAQKVAHTGNWEWKLKTNELYWSAENYKIFGLSPTINPTIENFLNTVHPDDLEFVKKSIDEALHGKPYDIDIHIIKPDGSDSYVRSMGIVDHDEEGNPIRMFGTVQDITERKLTEYELSKFKLGIERSNEAIFITDIDGTIIYFNPAFENLYGFKRKEVLGKTPRILKSGILPSEAYKPFWNTLLSKKVVSGELINKTKDGRLLNIEGSANPIMNDMGDIIGFLAIQRDITEHKRIIEMVKESEERFRSITQSANDAIITGDSKGNIIFWNNGAHNIFGFDNEEVIGKPLTVLMPEIYRDAHRNGLKRLVATGETHVIGNKVELSGMRKDGSLFPLELSLSTWNAGGAVFFTGIIGDITERKRVHKALMDSEEKYRKLYESSSDAIMLLDEKGFFDCNNATLQTFGFSNKEDFTKVHLSQVSPPYQPDGVDSLTAANNKIAEALRKGTNQFEWVHRNRNGEDFYADVLLNAFNFKGKRVLQATVRDITDRKRAQELHVVNVQLENESKAKSEFLASMSHELRTPLNAIIGFSDIMTLGIGGNLNETQKDYVNDIHNAGEHLLLIINDILDLSKVEAGKMELVNEKFSVHEMLEETITLIKFKAIKHHIKIIRDIDFQLEFMDGDKQKIIQVLFNLLSNAVKFSKEDGGTITIAVKKIDGMVSFSVSDTGIGIEKKNLDKLFKEFQQLDYGITRKYGGTGLGLVISKKLVELHGGKIIVESIYGEGSTFTFSIPVQQEVN